MYSNLIPLESFNKYNSAGSTPSKGNLQSGTKACAVFSMSIQINKITFIQNTCIYFHCLKNWTLSSKVFFFFHEKLQTASRICVRTLNYWDLRDGWADKWGCSFRRPCFEPQHLHGNWKKPQEIWCCLLASEGIVCMWNTDTHVDKTLLHLK